MGIEGAHMRFEPRAVEVHRDFGDVALDAALVQFARRNQNRDWAVVKERRRPAVSNGSDTGLRHLQPACPAVTGRWMGRAGFPATTVLAATTCVTTDPAPTVAPSPSSAITTAASPIQQSAPIIVSPEVQSVKVPSALRRCWRRPLGIS